MECTSSGARMWWDSQAVPCLHCMQVNTKVVHYKVPPPGDPLTCTSNTHSVGDTMAAT
jgi:hypothetical protein